MSARNGSLFFHDAEVALFLRVTTHVSGTSMQKLLERTLRGTNVVVEIASSWRAGNGPTLFDIVIFISGARIVGTQSHL